MGGFFAFLCISRKCRRETKTVLVASCRSETKEFLFFSNAPLSISLPRKSIPSFFAAAFSLSLLSVLVGGNDDYHRGRRYFLSFFEGLFVPAE